MSRQLRYGVDSAEKTTKFHHHHHSHATNVYLGWLSHRKGLVDHIDM